MTQQLFTDIRLGLFVHWGLYAIPGWHEQQQWRAQIPKQDYERLMTQFNPHHFSPDAWLDLAEAAGMQYVCLTAKHHDGFCLWDTDCTDYKVTRTPFGKDVVAMLAEACRRRGLRLSLYYSCPDWHHPNAINLGGDHQLPHPNPGDQPDLLKYIAYVRSQIRELCTRYGDLAQLFWDIPPRLDIPDLNAMVRELQPGILINDRGFGPGDYATPERQVPEGGAFRRLTEACQSVGAQAWGYRRDEDYHTAPYLCRCIDRILAMGGNYLLNVGPDQDGRIPEPAAAILRDIGAWYATAREAFVHAQPAPRLTTSRDVLLTRRGDTLYVHLPNGCNCTGLSLEPIAEQPVRATLLLDGSPVRAAVEQLPSFWRQGPCLHLSGLPADRLQTTVPIIRLDFAPGALDRLAAAPGQWQTSL